MWLDSIKRVNIQMFFPRFRLWLLMQGRKYVFMWCSFKSQSRVQKSDIFQNWKGYRIMKLNWLCFISKVFSSENELVIYINIDPLVDPQWKFRFFFMSELGIQFGFNFLFTNVVFFWTFLEIQLPAECALTQIYLNISIRGNGSKSNKLFLENLLASN